MGKSPVSGEAGTPHHLIKFTVLYGCSLYHPNTIKILTSKITDRDHHAMLCYAKSLQSCQTVCDPIDGSHQGPPSLGFSRQEHWSGLPFPSPMHESEKWKWSHSVVSDSATPWTATYQAPPSMGFLTRDHHNKYNNNERVWNIVRITKMWHRDMK